MKVRGTWRRSDGISCLDLIYIAANIACPGGRGSDGSQGRGCPRGLRGLRSPLRGIRGKMGKESGPSGPTWRLPLATAPRILLQMLSSRGWRSCWAMRLRLDSRLHQVWRCLKHSALVLNVTLGIGISAYVAPAYDIIWLYIYNIAIYLIRQSLATWTLRRGCKSTTKWSTYPEVLRTQHTLKACVLDMKSMSCIHCGVRTDSMYMYIYNMINMYNIYMCI